jgi:hypothetical protein
MAPEAAPGGGNFMTKKVMGLPIIVWVGGAALLAYIYFRSRSSASAGSPSTTGGGGTATTGGATLQKGAVQVTITQESPQPKPPVRGRQPGWHSHPSIPPRKKGATPVPHHPATHPKKPKPMPTVHRPPSKKHHGNVNVPKKKKKPVITNAKRA